jgi:hypothetical protein
MIWQAIIRPFNSSIVRFLPRALLNCTTFCAEGDMEAAISGDNLIFDSFA